ncbi:MAG: hypothetical protein EOO91_11860 [Pedobacter sp.]|nr:MAG: hypothetical protein EOO91_11860 [Pedobacter sp.]
MEKKEIIKSGFTSVVQIVITSLSYACIYWFVIAWLGKEQLGIWSIITLFPALASVLGVGVSGSLIRYIPSYLAQGKMKAISKIIINGIVFNLILGILIVALAFLFANPLLKFMFGISLVPHRYIVLYTIALVTFLINFINLVLLSALEGLQQIPLKNKILIGSALFFCCIAIPLIYLDGLFGLFYAQLAQSVFALISTFFMLRKTKLLRLTFSSFDFKIIKLFYTYGSHLQYISILNLFFEPATKFFLNRYFGLGVVGTYDLVNRIVSQLRLLIVSAIQIISPFVAKKSAAEHEEITNLYRKSFRGSLLLACILFGGLITASFSFIYLFSGIDIPTFQIIVIYSSVSMVINVLSVTPYAVAMGTGKLKQLTVMQALSTGLNMLFYLIMYNFRFPALMLLPTAASISISSLYILYCYRHVFAKISDLINFKDLFIYFASILMPLACIAASFYHFNVSLLLSIAALHALLIIYLVYKNQYLMNIASVIINQKRGTHG